MGQILIGNDSFLNVGIPTRIKFAGKWLNVWSLSYNLCLKKPLWKKFSTTPGVQNGGWTEEEAEGLLGAHLHGAFFQKSTPKTIDPKNYVCCQKNSVRRDD